MKRNLYTAKELERLAGINPGTIRNLVSAGLPVAGKGKARRGKPTNLYDAAAVNEWWTRRAACGKWNWTARAILDRLGKLAGIKSKKRKPLTDDEMRALGFSDYDIEQAKKPMEDCLKGMDLAGWIDEQTGRKGTP